MVVIRRVRPARPPTCSGRGSSRCGRRASARRPRRSARPAPPAPRTTSSRPTASTSSARSAASTRSTSSGCCAGSPTAAGTRRPKNGNFHLYTLVLGSQTLHATGLRDGHQLRRQVAAPATPRRDEAVIVYFGDGASSQGDVNEAMVFAASYQTPQVFFLQNNQWAISVPVATPVAHPAVPARRGLRHPERPGRRQRRARQLRRHARRASTTPAPATGPRSIEALTYRMGAHTTSDDPTKYRTADEERVLGARATRSPACATYLRGRGRGRRVLRRRGCRGRGRRRRHAARAHRSSSAAPDRR